jgi:hypothetical protein
MGRVDHWPGQYMEKNYYYHSFKTWFRGRPEARPGSYWQLTWVNLRIKMIIIIVKTRLGGRPRIRLGSSVGLAIDLGKYNDKNSYYHSFKTQFRSRLGAKLESSWPLTRVNIRIKVVIIVFLKPDSGIDPMQDPSHESGWPLT